jgi:DNA-binding IclR family transcriptional regulator
MTNEVTEAIPAESGEREGARTVGRVLRVLELIAVQSEPMRGIDIARALNVPTSSAHALLQQLINFDYVNVVGHERRYVQGPGLALLAGRIRSGLQLFKVARPVLESLAAEVGENIYLGVRQAKGIAYADSVEAGFGVMARFPLGSLRPLHCTSPGRVFLAFHVPPAQLDDVLGPEPLQAFTSHTMTDRTALRQQLDEIRATGYAINEQQILDDAYGVTAPVFSAERVLIGCVTIGMPGVRYKVRKRLAIERVLAAAAEISRGMGVEDWQAVVNSFRKQAPPPP